MTLTSEINFLSNAALSSAFLSGVGYLCTRAVIHFSGNTDMHPYAGLAIGAASGAIIGIFGAKGANVASILVGIAALVFVPYKLCQRLELATTFKGTLIVTACTVVAYAIFFAALKLAYKLINDGTLTPEGGLDIKG